MSKVKKGERTIFVCDGKKCCRYNEETKSCFKALLEESGLSDDYSVCKMKCQGMCKSAPVVYISSHDKYKKEVGAKKAKKIFQEYIIA
ncbi:(2Fe-2S) ferredoxin domain-containing protein [Myroides sp. M-43]|uniref:(2Fe-2S) ferredoxin domain-containing protein n=1 Tax=Myroides oncorhynchi TaxID=2893756 RepID=UPI001E4F5EBF|nr:(2Fe-2S) ferredoxin domain-containing protein [Myroides oncorhynchi]MCC9043732.1 (2Fe-2S) ferredoxin domain-containing protein [Myroides oncorhynchi]